MPALKGEAEIAQRFSQGYTAIKSYLRYTVKPQTNA